MTIPGDFEMERPASARKWKVALLVLLSSVLLILFTESNTYRKSLKRSKEAVSRQDLARMREAIKNYTADEKRPPQSLQDLLDKHYLRVISTDPLTGKKDWVPHFSNVAVGAGKTSFGIDDIHSSTDSEGIR